MKSVGCCSGESLHQLRWSPSLFKGGLCTSVRTPYKIRFTVCTSNTSKSQHCNYRQGQQPALASPRRTARNERIPPDDFNMAALEDVLHRRTPPPASLVPLPFQGRLMHKRANAVQNKVYRLYKQYLKEPTLQLQARATTGVGKPQADSEVRANSAGRFRHGCTRKLLPLGKPAGRCCRFP